MAPEKPDNAFSQGFQFTSLPQLKWPKVAIETSALASAKALSFTAKQLEAQAEFMQGLATCKDLPELLKRQSDFWAAVWGDYATELAKIVQAGQASEPPQNSGN